MIEGFIRKLSLLIIMSLLGASTSGAFENTAMAKGASSDFHGFTLRDFEVGDLSCKVVAPKVTAKGTPWVWRARFFGHEPQLDIALLQRGFHVAYVDVSDLYGAPKAVDRFNRFYEYLTTQHGFDPKPALEALSRGGLIAYNWAIANPDKLSCIYADAPVCDFRSWPGGKGSSAGSANDWERCLKAYGLDEETALIYDKNPIDQLANLAKAGIPILHVVGDVDAVVPVAENTAIVERRYKALGGSIEVIHKPNVGHHPHSLNDPTPMVDFILKHRSKAI
ncbi:MAG: alpha/beta hydrolase family protein [Opitutaceae bacterium]